MATTSLGATHGVKQRKRINFKSVHKWDAIFKDGTKYRDLNEIFVLQLLATHRRVRILNGCGTRARYGFGMRNRRYAG